MDDRWTAAARANVPPFHVMDMIAASATRQRTHGDAVNLLSGQPSTGAPAAVAEEAVRLLRSGDPLGYTPATGILELREAIAGHYGSRYDLEVSPDDVIVTTGASGGFLLAFLAAFEVGDKVAMARPNYPCYRNVLQALGCQVVEIETGPETRFQPTVEQLAQLHEAEGGDLKGVLLASPANPTGTMVLPEELAAIAAWCEEHRVQLISDEIYHGIEYAPLDGHAPLARCAWETSREAVVFGSFSKYFSMTGWRIGWLLAPGRLRRAIDVLTGNFTICPPTIAQRAAVRAFTPAAIAELDGHVTRYAANRRLLLEGLPRLGITRLAPADGAFYVYADVGHLTDDTMAFAHQLLATTGVAVAPGIDFDTTDGGRFLRMSFAGDAAEISEALERLSTAVGR
ncbi:pyridoxal phosphate-dependent aminotransferase [Nocardioides sp. CER19]|uniref:pyridoxal phosphate-dependent aminotransferase n=1 Tax=Nocardioides sp. CER19 TaxID=3038538 RepID=UPI002446BA58|nr:pyridoxal phosphate-dependent aminotransferase [Nocardioides sp. CER19]MDH2412647.1 pyridoxal phosphate-dependent aminotransferase [Nocardioides sp. CER19]